MTDIVPVDRNPASFLCERYRDRIEDALNYSQVTGAGLLSFEAFTAAVADDLLRDRAVGKGDLWRAFQNNPESAMGAMQMAAQLKLLPGSKYGLFWLIPRMDKGRLTVMGQTGYKGLCTVSGRHPRVHSIEAFLVYRGERFSFNAGTGKVEHEYDMLGEREDKDIVGGFMKAVITEEATHHAVIDAPIIWPMTIKEILKRRAASDAYRSMKGKSPWDLWMPEMCRKTILIAGLNHGSVPRDLGLGGILTREAEEDRVHEPTALPKMTRQQEIRQDLGLEEKQESFASAEHAVEFIRTADKAALEAARGRWDWLQGSDVETVARAYEDRLEELGA